MEMISRRIMIDLAECFAFLRPNAAGEIAEMIDRERQIGALGFADRLAVVDRLDQGKKLELLFDTVGDLVEDRGPLGRRGLAPGVLRLVRGVERKLDIGGLRARDLAHGLAGDRADVVEVIARRQERPICRR